jgi:hypothetical protein
VKVAVSAVVPLLVQALLEAGSFLDHAQSEKLF